MNLSSKAREAAFQIQEFVPPIGRVLIALLSFSPLFLATLHAQEARTALVMGVWDYADSDTLPTLPGVDNDVAAMKEKLIELGFEVTTVTNPSLGQAEKAVEDFGAKLKSRRGVGLFYFSGHGAEFEGTNYLLPKNARLTSNRDLRDAGLNANRILNRMEDSGTPVNLIFLDCCRNSLSKSAGGGLAPMQAKGLFVGFATASQKVAQASTGGSLYTKALVKRLGTPGVSITDMHTLVTRDVQNQAASGSQTPFQYSGLNELFFLRPGPAAPAAPRGEIPRDPPGKLITLFDGSDTSAWTRDDGRPADWAVANGALEARYTSLMTKKKFQDFKLHVEFLVPTYTDPADGLARGNSGVYLQGRYEVQILDGFGVAPTTRDCGAIFNLRAPDRNASTKPGTWQIFDITFRAARYDQVGRKSAMARATVIHNGVLIHDNVEIFGSTGTGFPEGKEAGPILLQSWQGNTRVRFRNIWIVPQ